MNTERATVFGEDAGSYERFRPSYPAEAIDHILSLTEVRRAAEVGAGTGKATEAVARPGLDLLCLEPSAPMAEILRSKNLAGVEVLVTSFEDWEPDQPFDLVYAAQAWHWVDRSTAYDRAKAALRPGGALALMWNLQLDRFGELTDIYAAHAPELLREEDERIARRDGHDWLEDMSSAGLADVELFSVPWVASIAAEELAGLLSTYSDHMMLEPDRRKRLLDAISRQADREGGIRLDYRTEVFTGIVPDTTAG